MNIYIEKRQVLHEAALTAAYLAARNDTPDGEGYDALALAEVDTPVVEGALLLAARRLADIFLPYTMHDAPTPTAVPAESRSEALLALTVRPSLAVTQQTVDYWQQLAVQWLVATAMVAWLEAVAPGRAQRWRDRLAQLQVLLSASLTTRTRRPRKRMEVL